MRQEHFKPSKNYLIITLQLMDSTVVLLSIMPLFSNMQEY
nr:MAG TPA: hypothetical protein [Caudoviricetes sp.]